MTEPARREPRCDASDLPVSMCAHCRPAATQAPAEDFDTTPEIVGPRFPARYPSTCVAGLDPIEVGASIGRASTGGYMHQACGTTIVTSRRFTEWND